ncbi:MAG: L-rhamnose mutarotase [Phycisphaerales bacterium]|nr:MAG: L-rhamnose mutarotase [Phycisphaerales bacterium]
MKLPLKSNTLMAVLFAFALLLSGCAGQEKTIRRFGRIAILGPDEAEEYRRKLYVALPPHVLQELSSHNIGSYSIYVKDLKEAQPCLFAYFEYTGDNFDVDMAEMMRDEAVERWNPVAAGVLATGESSGTNEPLWIDMEQVFYFAGKTHAQPDESKVRRYGTVIGLRAEMVESYKLLHKYAWPEVLAAIERGNIRSYSIYLHRIEDEFYLFSYFEYTGDDFDMDMALIDNDPATKAWIKFTDKGCQLPIPTRAEGEWWAEMEEVFHLD